MTEERGIVGIFEDQVRAAGFTKRGRLYWRAQEHDLVELIHLQRSTYGPKYYLNVGFWLTDLADSVRPKLETSHLRARAVRLFPSWESRLDAILDLESDESEIVRERELRTFLDSALFPFLNRVRSAEDLVSSARDELDHMMIRPEARNRLGL